MLPNLALLAATIAVVSASDVPSGVGQLKQLKATSTTDPLAGISKNCPNYKDCQSALKIEKKLCAPDGVTMSEYLNCLCNVSYAAYWDYLWDCSKCTDDVIDNTFDTKKIICGTSRAGDTVAGSSSGSNSTSSTSSSSTSSTSSRRSTGDAIAAEVGLGASVFAFAAFLL